MGKKGDIPGSLCRRWLGERQRSPVAALTFRPKVSGIRQISGTMPATLTPNALHRTQAQCKQNAADGVQNQGAEGMPIVGPLFASFGLFYVFSFERRVLQDNCSGKNGGR